ncbi:MAG: acyl-CoA thioesterase [Chloroflexi bacterium]|nr:acyl-CoA thioesterase [Chloroflexota bacterium]
MPVPTFERTFIVRHNECDAYGHVSNTHYLRYMQETAFDASAAMGYDIQWYEQAGHWWFIRETEIEYLAPLQYGDRVTVKTWSGQFWRVHAYRHYELINPDTDQVIARAVSDWAYVDAEQTRPAAIPDDLRQTFTAGETSLSNGRRLKFVEPPPPPVRPYHMQRRVEWRDVDSAKHVNNAAYLEFLIESAVRAPGEFGWPMEQLVERGIGIYARKHHIQYKAQARLADLLDVKTWLHDVWGVRATRYYEIRQGDTLITRANSMFVLIDIEKGKFMRFTDGFSDDFKDHIATPNADQ